MKKYQVVETSENFNHAGSKATQDIAAIADGLGYRRLTVRMNTTRDTKIAKLQRQMGYLKDWEQCLKSVEDGAIILLQHPFHYPQLTRERTLSQLKEKKHVKYICLIHDVEELRAFRYNDYYEREFEFMMKIADVWIVHNERMKAFFIERGAPEERLVSLDIFDYLQEDLQKSVPAYENSITVAGNLDTAKCGYIGQLGQLSDVEIHLYGMNYNAKMDKYRNIHYFGSFPSDEIPDKLKSGFGLVWDGESVDGCVGQSGQYLRYNNPHKLSLYLSSGLPVVIWKEAAEAAFVTQHGVGICVDSLHELTALFKRMDQTEYAGYIDSVKQIASRLRTGQFGRTAILRAESILKV